MRLIFERRAAGFGYGQLLTELGEKGYRTKRGGQFGKIACMTCCAIKNISASIPLAVLPAGGRAALETTINKMTI